MSCANILGRLEGGSVAVIMDRYIIIIIVMTMITTLIVVTLFLAVLISPKFVKRFFRPLYLDTNSEHTLP